MDSERRSNLSHHLHQFRRTHNTKLSMASLVDTILNWHFVNLLLYPRIQAARQARLLPFHHTRSLFPDRNMVKYRIHARFHVVKYRKSSPRTKVSLGFHHFSVHRERLPRRRVGMIVAGEWILGAF
jgi:hypothetical protein